MMNWFNATLVVMIVSSLVLNELLAEPVSCSMYCSICTECNNMQRSRRPQPAYFISRLGKRGSRTFTRDLSFLRRNGETLDLQGHTRVTRGLHEPVKSEDVEY